MNAARLWLALWPGWVAGVAWQLQQAALWDGSVYAALVLLALTWGRLAPAGIIASVALALLLHVTLVIGLLSLGYQVLERLVSGPPDSRGIRPGVR